MTKKEGSLTQPSAGPLGYTLLSGSGESHKEHHLAQVLPYSCWEDGPLHNSKVGCVHQSKEMTGSQWCRCRLHSFGSAIKKSSWPFNIPLLSILFYLFIFVSSWGFIVSTQGPGQCLARDVLPSPAKTPPFYILNSIPILTKNWKPGGSDLHSVFHDNYLFRRDLQRSLDSAWHSLAFNESFHHLLLGSIIQY